MVFVLLFLVFSIPAVQTKAGKYITNRINTKYNISIQVEKLGLRWNGDLNLKDVLIKDHQEDTLIYVRILSSSILNATKAIKGNLELGKVRMKDPKFYFTIYKDEKDANITVFAKKFIPEQPEPQKEPFHFISDRVTLEDGAFRYLDYNIENPEILNYTQINSGLDDFEITGSHVEILIDRLAFNSTQGYQIDEISGAFIYGSEHMELDNMILKTHYSHIEGTILIDSPEGMSDFANAVQLNMALTQASISTSDIYPFYKDITKDKIINLQGNFTGTLNDLSSDNLRLHGLNSTSIRGPVRFKQLLNPSKLIIEAQNARIQTSYFDLKSLLPKPLQSLPQRFSKLGITRFDGTTAITPNTVLAKGLFDTNLGSVDVDIDLLNPQDISNATYSGNVKFDNFDLGTLIDNPKVGTTSLDVNVNGKGFIQEYLDTQLTGNIEQISFNGYDYSNITIFGDLRTPVFNGELFIDDPNLEMEVVGLIDVTKQQNTYDITAAITKADLHKLQLVKDSTAILKGNIDMDMTGSGIEDAFGELTFKNTSYKNKYDTYFFKDFTVASSFDKDLLRTIAVNSEDIVEGNLSGKFKFNEVIPLFRNAIGSLYTNYQSEVLTENQFMDFDFTVNNKIVEVFVPDLHLDPETRVYGKVNADESNFKLTFKSPGIQAYGSQAKAVEVVIDNKNPLFNTFVGIDSINTRYYNVADLNLINVTLKDTLFMTTEFKGGKSFKDNYDLAFYHTINTEGKSVLGFKKSSILFKENEWLINKENNFLNSLVFDNNFKNLFINTISLNYKDEEIAISGELREKSYKDVKAEFVNVDMTKFLDEIENLDLSGTIDGDVALLQKGGVYYPSSTLSVNQLTVNQALLGDLDLNITGDNSLASYVIDSKLVKNDVRHIDAQGTITIGKNEPKIDLDVALNKFDVRPFSPLGGEVITNIRGLVNGNAAISGSYQSPDIDGELKLANGGFTIPYLNVNYTTGEEATIALNKQEFIFKTVFLEDPKYQTLGILNGNIAHRSFSDWELGLDILIPDKFLVLDTEEDEESLYYGTAFVSGEAAITGSTDELVIDVIAETEEGTVFNIPIDDAESIGDNSFIHFLTPEEKAARIKGKVLQAKEVKGLSLNFDLDVDQDAEIEIVVDKTNGSTLKGRGAGNLLIEINTNGKFNMWGDFVVYEGGFNFRYAGLVQKKFNIVTDPLGDIRWDGNPFKALLDISAAYRAEANPSVLLENPSINRKIPVDVIINLKGELIQPDITFNLEYPNTSSTVAAELDFRLSDRTSRERNAISLVSQNTFINETSISAAGAVNNVLESGTSILNSVLFNNNDGVFDVGLDLVQADRTPDAQASGRVGFTLSTQITNRVLINGKVGVPTGGLSESVIVGDVEVDFLLNQDGSLRAKVFSRQTDVQFIGETEGYTQGAGLSYAVDFNSFKELIAKLFKGKKKEVAEELKKIEDQAKDLDDDGVTFKQD